MKKLIFFTLLGVSSFASAQITRVPGTDVYYKLRKDAMSDLNTSSVYVFEINDTDGYTLFRIECRGGGKRDVYLLTKNPLMTEEQRNAEEFPSLMYRIDKFPAKTIPSEGVTVDDEPSLNNLAFSEKNQSDLIQALTVGNKVAVRVLRNGMKQLDYTFNAKGFIAGMKAVQNCK